MHTKIQMMKKMEKMEKMEQTSPKSIQMSIIIKELTN